MAVDALRRIGMLHLANTPAGSLTLLQRKRLELGRALATRPRLLLLDEIAGGLTEGEVLELVELIAEIRRSGVALVWIEHIVHALLRVVDRMMAVDVGRKLIEGDPADVMASDEVRASTSATTWTRARERAARTRRTRRVGYGDFQALFGIDLHVTEGETVSIIGANGAGKSTLLNDDRRAGGPRCAATCATTASPR